MKLWLENASLEAACFTIQLGHFLIIESSWCLSSIRKLYDTLVSQLNSIAPGSTSSNSPINVNVLQASVLQHNVPIPWLKAEDHPLVWFWTPLKWKEWNETAEGQLSKSRDKSHNIRYLEDALGQPLNSTWVCNILNCMWDIWHGFHLQNLIDANTTWTTMSLALMKALRSKMVESHPETNLGKDRWKIDRLAKDHYSSFKQTWFTNKSEEKWAEKRKMKSKGPGDSTDGSIIAPDSQATSEPVPKHARYNSMLSDSKSVAHWQSSTTILVGSSNESDANLAITGNNTLKTQVTLLPWLSPLTHSALKRM